MSNTKPPVRVSDKNNEIVKQYPLPIKKGYYDKYPNAMKMLESSAYGKNEVILQALEYVYETFPINIVDRASVRAVSSALGFDKNGNKLTMKNRNQNRKSSFSSNTQNLVHSKSNEEAKKELQVIQIKEGEIYYGE